MPSPCKQHCTTHHNTTHTTPPSQVEIDKPIGLRFAQSKAAGGGLEVTGVSGNAAKSGIKVGDTVIYTSSFFGDELWPADKLAFSVRGRLMPGAKCWVLQSVEAAAG